jgi:hypothetical protein
MNSSAEKKRSQEEKNLGEEEQHPVAPEGTNH